MSVTAAQVKELRERTGAAMMDCKKALETTQGDVQLAAEELRKSGRAKADKKAGNITAEGGILIQLSDDAKQAVMVEINSQTDFVGRDSNFLEFAKSVVNTAFITKTDDPAKLSTLPLNGQDGITIEEARQALVTKVGENICIRRAVFVESAHPMGKYLHNQRIGALVELDSDNREIANDVAIHIVACKPLVIEPSQVSEEIVAKEKEIYLAQAAGSGKPQEIIEKMVQGRLNKFLDEVSLLGQPFVKDLNLTIASLLAKHHVKVLKFTRFELGEGIQKQTEDFAAAVMAQANIS
jgi:elongation factor Ts